LEENQDFLNTNANLSVFFRWDAPLLTAVDKINYALRCDAGNERLLAMKCEPYNMLFFGSPACAEEVLAFIMDGGYELKSYLCGLAVGDRMLEILKEKYGIVYEEALAMDFMRATEVTEPSDESVTMPCEEDLDEIVECVEAFVKDCGLLDRVDREKTLKSIASYRVIKQDGRIISMAKRVPDTENDVKLSAVYTRPEYRGQGIARKVVNTLKNEILSEGKAATLNVDKKNPISNHLYSSLGFKRIFSQGEYRRVEA